MRRTFLTMAVFCLAACQMTAAIRTKIQAHQIASQILDKPQALSISSSLYIYNNENKPGFAIISNSDLIRPVIGYSDTGTIDPDNMPSNLKSWLKWVDETTLWLEEHPECRLDESQMAATSAIAPIMGNIAWGQDYPYNAKCPTGTPAGCVATAAAQCVYHYQYPATGIGSHTNANDPSQTINFSQVSYDYDLMFDKYSQSGSYSSAQLNEVAKLSYHCGVMSDMSYNADGSSSSLINLRRGLVENLGYAPYCQVVYRSVHTYSEWQNYIQSELTANRPVVMAGSCNNGTEGHCFVVDGLNSNGLYHVNWGWSGSYDGYYDITILNPDGVGTGASISNDGFCTDQSMLAQLAPKGTLSHQEFISPICAPSGSLNISTTSAKSGEFVTLSVTPLYNYSADDMTGKFGLAFVQNGQIVKYATYTSSAVTMPGSVSGQVYGINLSYAQAKLPSSLAAGNYQVYACFIPSSGDFENECALIYCKATAPSYYNCTISGGKATFSKGSYAANVSASNWSFDEQKPSAGIKETITCQLTNNDDACTLVGKYYLYVTSPSGQSTYVEAENPLTLAPNATGTLTFRPTFSQAGTWKSKLYIFYQNVDTDTSKGKKALNGTDKTFSVETNPTIGANFSLLATPTLVKNESYGDKLFIGSPASFSVNIKDSGEAYTGTFQMQLFKSSTSSIIIGTVTGDISVPANSEGTYTISGDLTKVASSFPAASSGTNYIAKVYYDYAGTYKLLPAASGVTARFSVRVYAGSPSTGIENLESETTMQNLCVDLQGRRATSNRSGLLIRNGKVILQK